MEIDLPPLLAKRPVDSAAFPPPPAPSGALSPPNNSWIGGAFTALVTPFEHDRIAKKAFADLIAWQIEEGARGLITGGAIGEASTLSPQERVKLVEIAVETAAGRAPVIAATGTNCTATTIALTRAAQAAGATAALVVAPYYSRPGQEGLFQHFRALAGAVSLPLLLENDPARTAIDILPGTLARLAALPNIIGLADWSDGAFRSDAPALPQPFFRLSCQDFAATPRRISTLANLAPRLIADWGRATESADRPRAAALRTPMESLSGALRLEDGPGPIKYALSLLRPGFKPHMRLPLVAIRYETASAIVAALTEADLLR